MGVNKAAFTLMSLHHKRISKDGLLRLDIVDLSFTPTGSDPTLRLALPRLWEALATPESSQREARPSRDYCQIVLMSVPGLLWDEYYYDISIAG
jgi:hypothetical protein